MNILVTGGNGFIGRALIKKLKQNKENTVTSIRSRDFDLRDRAATKDVFSLNKYDTVVMLAANMGGIGYISNLNLDFQIMADNLRIDINTIEAAQKSGVRHVIYASSACVYSPQTCEEYKSVKEYQVYPYEPDSGYGWAKLTTENMLATCKVPYTIARLHTIYGPGSIFGEKEKVPIAICRKVINAADGDTVNVWGDGTQQRTFCYISDAVTALEKMLAKPTDCAINIGHDELVSINELVDYVIQISGKNLTKKYIPGPIGVKTRGTDLTRAGKLLDWYPEVGWQDGMKKTYDWVNFAMGNR